jgi:hypothetical protein
MEQPEASLQTWMQNTTKERKTLVWFRWGFHNNFQCKENDQMIWSLCIASAQQRKTHELWTAKKLWDHRHLNLSSAWWHFQWVQPCGTKNPLRWVYGTHLISFLWALKQDECGFQCPQNHPQLPQKSVGLKQIKTIHNWSFMELGESNCWIAVQGFGR